MIGSNKRMIWSNSWYKLAGYFLFLYMGSVLTIVFLGYILSSRNQIQELKLSNKNQRKQIEIASDSYKQKVELASVWYENYAKGDNKNQGRQIISNFIENIQKKMSQISFILQEDLEPQLEREQIRVYIDNKLNEYVENSKWNRFQVGQRRERLAYFGRPLLIYSKSGYREFDALQIQEADSQRTSILQSQERKVFTN